MEFFILWKCNQRQVVCIVYGCVFVCLCDTEFNLIIIDQLIIFNLH